MGTGGRQDGARAGNADEGAEVSAIRSTSAHRAAPGEPHLQDLDLGMLALEVSGEGGEIAEEWVAEEDDAVVPAAHEAEAEADEPHGDPQNHTANQRARHSILPFIAIRGSGW